MGSGWRWHHRSRKSSYCDLQSETKDFRRTQNRIAGLSVASKRLDSGQFDLKKRINLARLLILSYSVIDKSPHPVRNDSTIAHLGRRKSHSFDQSQVRVS